MRASAILATVVAVVLMAGTATEAALEDGMRGYWRFEGNGDDELDIADLTDIGGTSYSTVDPVAGQYVIVHATASAAGFINSFPATTWGLTDEFTISAWARPDDIGHNGTREIMRPQDGTCGWYSWDGVSPHGFWAKHNDGTWYSEAVSLSQTEGTWYHVVQVLRADGTVEAWHAAKSSTDHTSYDYTDTISPYNGMDVSTTAGTVLKAAYMEGGSSDSIQGFDEIAIWSRALSPSEIEQLFDMGKSGTALPAPPPPSYDWENGLQGYWPLDGNGNDRAGTTHFPETASGVSYDAGAAIAGEAAVVSQQPADHAGFLRNPLGTTWDITTEFSLSTWYRIDNVGTVGGGSRSGFYTCCGDRLGWYNPDDAAQHSAHVIHSGDNWSIIDFAGPDKAGDMWYHILQVVRSTGVHEAWIASMDKGHGGPYTTVTMAGFTSIDTAAFDQTWMAWYESGVHGGRIRMDEVAIWNRALSSDEIEVLFRMGKAGTAIVPYRGTVVVVR